MSTAIQWNLEIGTLLLVVASATPLLFSTVIEPDGNNVITLALGFAWIGGSMWTRGLQAPRDERNWEGT